MTYSQRLGRAVKVLLAARNMGHKELAGRLGISPSRLSRILSGDAGVPSVRVLGDAIGVEWHVLASLAESPEISCRRAEEIVRALRDGWDDADDEDAP